MDEPAKDFEEVDHEEVILTRWQKLKNWADIFKTTFTIGKILWGLLFVSAGAVVVGEVTDTKPVRDLSEYAGIVPPDTGRAALLARIDALEEADERLNAALERRQNGQGAQGPRGPAGKVGAQGPAGESGKDGKDGIDSADLDAAIMKLLPKDHDGLH